MILPRNITKNGDISSVSQRDAYRAAVKGDLDTVRVLYRRNASSTISAAGDTVLHVLAFYRQVDVVKTLLLESTSRVGLAVQNCKGNTALHEAVRSGSMAIVQAMAQKDESLVLIANHAGETPLYWAAAYGENDILHFLLGINCSDNLFKRNDSSTILHAAVTGEFYSVAQEIISLYPALAFLRNDFGLTALDLVAGSPASFKSSTIFSWKNLGSGPFVPLQLLAMFIYLCLPGKLPIRNKKTVSQQENLRSGLKWLPWIKMIEDAKHKHICAEQVVRQLLTISVSSVQDDFREPLLAATRYGIVEVVKNILAEFPEAIEFVDNNEKNILHLSVEYRREQVFKFLKSKNFPISRMVADVDMFGNTVFHHAAKVGEPPIYVHGAYQKISWEVYWFKQVENISLPHLLSLRNYNGHTAEELFKDTHGNVLEEAERWVKNTTNSTMVISTLIATINFTAAFTVPGGFDQNTGFPIFINKHYFVWYVFFLSEALFLSLISLGAAFCANLSRFNEEDYYLFLPLKFFIGVSTFFASVICTICAYGLGLYSEGRPIATTLTSTVVVFGVLCAHLLTGIVFIDMVWPYLQNVVTALLLSLSYNLHPY